MQTVASTQSAAKVKEAEDNLQHAFEIVVPYALCMMLRIPEILYLTEMGSLFARAALCVCGKGKAGPEKKEYDMKASQHMCLADVAKGHWQESELQRLGH